MSTRLTVFVSSTVRDFAPVRRDLREWLRRRHIDVRESLGLRVGGFGILMTKGLVDEMEYNRAGNEVRLAKYFEPKPSVTGAPA